MTKSTYKSKYQGKQFVYKDEDEIFTFGKVSSNWVTIEWNRGKEGNNTEYTLEEVEEAINNGSWTLK